MSGSFQIKREWPVLLLLLVPFLALFFLWDRLPDAVPIHWDMNGEPDRIVGKTTGLLLMPCIGVAIYLLFWLIPALDPKRRVSLQKKPLPALRFLLILVLTFLFFANVAAMLGVEGIFGARNLMLLGVLLLFLVIGNYLPAVQPNYFIGIRTPWTLQDEDIWRQTHRISGRIWVVCSLGLIVAWTLLSQPAFARLMFAVVIGVMVLVPVAYSLFLYLQQRRAQSDAHQ